MSHLNPPVESSWVLQLVIGSNVLEQLLIGALQAGESKINSCDFNQAVGSRGDRNSPHPYGFSGMVKENPNSIKALGMYSI
jgi:hypothetical protein